MIYCLPESVLEDLDFIRELIEHELGYSVRSKERHPKLMMAQRLFVNLVNIKYGINKSSNRPESITRPLLASYMGYDSYISINHFLSNFNYFLNHHPELEEKWNVLSKLIMDNDRCILEYLREERKEVRQEINKLNKKIHKLKRHEKDKNQDHYQKKVQKEKGSTSYLTYWR